MNEFELIKRLTGTLATNASVVAGAGDDCAVVDPGIPGKFILLKTDAVVEGVHFTAETPPERVGHKALARCLSDIAAMAGTPGSALITLALAKNWNLAYVEKIYAGMNDLARRHGVAIVGGETTSNPERTLISVALMGTVPRDKCILRSGAKVGDAIFVTGELGGSIAGKHLDFEPRLAEARWLADHFAIHAMIDLSDGLAGDLRHILHAGKVGAVLHDPAIPISRAAKLAYKLKETSKPPLLAALTDGEDFELLFTAAPGDAVRLLDEWKREFPKIKLSCIGKIVPGEGVKIGNREGVRTLAAHGYTHFS